MATNDDGYGFDIHSGPGGSSITPYLQVDPSYSKQDKSTAKLEVLT